MVEHWLQLIRESSATPWAMPAFVGCYLLGTSLLMPALTFHVLAGLTWGFWPGLLASQLGLNLAGNAQFLLGRKLGQQRVSAWLKRRGWQRLEPLVHANGVWGVVALRQLPLPFVGVNLLAGASPLKWPHFALGSALGGLAPMTVHLWFASELYGGAVEARRGAMIRVVLAGTAVVVASLLPRVWLYLRGRAQTSPR